MRLTRAIVRQPGRSIVAGLSSSRHRIPDYDKALEQHQGYVSALKQCGLRVEILQAEETYPDSTFVEDVAVLTPCCAILTNPGAETRKGEVALIRQPLQQYFAKIERITSPGTLEGGDVMQIGSHFYIGLSHRTNQSGARQLISILEKHNMTGSVVPVSEFLHLKTGVTPVDEKTLVATGEFIDHPDLKNFNIIPIAAEESHAANCIRINDAIIISGGYPKAKAMIQKHGLKIIEVDISEFAKIDGGLTCLSLMF